MHTRGKVYYSFHQRYYILLRVKLLIEAPAFYQNMPLLPPACNGDPAFYRAMHFSAKRGLAIACRPSGRPSVCDVGDL